jgi:hypothetical protein
MEPGLHHPVRQVTVRLLRTLFAMSGALALWLAASFTRPTTGLPIPLPSSSVFGDTPPPISATATPKPEGKLVRYSGQILDYRRGFVFFTTGDGYRVAPTLKIDDAKTRGATTLAAATRTYAVATFDSASGNVIELGLSSSPLPSEGTYQDVHGFAIALSTPYPNPDLKPAAGFDGKSVLVSFIAEVPPDTAFDAAVYLATDASGWSATAIRMDRIDALHYRVSRSFASGTKLLYRYTLGSWQSAEQGQNGLQVTPRSIVIHNGDVQTQHDIVYHWGQANEFNPQNGEAPPTPYNPIPFNTPPHRG